MHSPLPRLLWTLTVLVGAGLVSSAGAGEGPRPVEAVPAVDLERYAGLWYEVARLPNRFQDDCGCCVTATYTLREDGRLTVLNQCREEDGGTKGVEGEAKLAREEGPTSKLKVRFAPGFLSFLGFVWGDYWVLGLDAGYTRALVGSPDRKYLWILSRDPGMEEAAYEALLAEAGSMGFDVSRVRRTPQEE